MMHCDSDNVEQFRAALKAALPDGYALVLELYRAGLIEGLRGMALAPCPPGLPYPAGVPFTLSAAAEKRLAQNPAHGGDLT